MVWNIFYVPIYWVSNHPNWLSFFSEGFKPPTSQFWVEMIWNEVSVGFGGFPLSCPTNKNRNKTQISLPILNLPPKSMVFGKFRDLNLEVPYLSGLFLRAKSQRIPNFYGPKYGNCERQLAQDPGFLGFFPYLLSFTPYFRIFSKAAKQLHSFTLRCRASLG